jgi:hypothetical protein
MVYLFNGEPEDNSIYCKIIILPSLRTDLYGNSMKLFNSVPVTISVAYGYVD